MTSSDIDKAEDEVFTRLLSQDRYNRLSSFLPKGKWLSRGTTVKFIGEYLWFAIHTENDPDRMAREYISDTTSALQTIKTRGDALLRSLKAFRAHNPTKLERTIFDREIDLVDLNELSDALADLLGSCDYGSAEIQKRIKRKPVDRLRWAFVKESLRIWVITVGSIPPKTTQGNKRQAAAARRNGSFADFVCLLQELVPDAYRPNSISNEFLKDVTTELQEQMEVFLKSGGQIPSRYLELDP